MLTTRTVALAGLADIAPLAGCTIPPPPGDAPLRYRDAVFSSVSVTRDLTYGSITTDDPPAIFFHGTEDRVVFYDWAVSNAAAMYDLGLRVVLEPFAGAGHGLAQAGHGQVIHEQASYFLYSVLGLAHADGSPAAAARVSAPSPTSAGRPWRSTTRS